MRHELWWTMRNILQPWWCVLLSLLALLGGVSWLVFDGSLPTSIVMSCQIYWVAILGFFVDIRLAEPRARLIPRYQRAHVLACGLLFLLPLCLNSVLLLLQSDNSSASYSKIAWLWALSTCFLWIFQIRRPLHAVPFVLAMGVAFELKFLVQEVMNETVAALLIWALSVVALVWLGRHFLTLPEEACVKRRNWLLAMQGKQLTERFIIDDLFRRRPPDGSLNDPHLQRRFPPGNEMIPLLRRLRGASAASPWWILLIGASVSIIGILSFAFWGMDLHRSAGGEGGFIAMVAVMGFWILTVMLPCMSMTTMIFLWMGCAERGALWPVSRRRAVAAVFLNVCHQTLFGWLALVVAVAALVLLWRPAVLLALWPWQVTFWSLTGVIFLSGLAAYLCRRFSGAGPNIAFQWLPVAILTFTMAPLGLLRFLLGPKDPSPEELWNAMPWQMGTIVCAGLGLLGGIAVWRAYRSWTKGYLA